MLFDLANMPASFLRYTHRILVEKFDIFIIVESDDIFIYITKTDYVDSVYCVFDKLK